jgi:hypothetical protein
MQEATPTQSLAPEGLGGDLRDVEALQEENTRQFVAVDLK